MKALVTGANGFIGKHLSRKLVETGWEIRNEFPGCDVIFHLAGVRDQDVWGGNVGGTAQILKLAAAHGVRRMVYPASAAAVNPLNDYGKSKQMAEELGWWYKKQYGLEVVMPRLFNVYGPGQRAGWVFDFEQAIKNNKSPLIYGQGQHVRDFTHVDDAVGVLIVAATAPSPLVSYEAGTGVGTKIIDLWNVCAEISGSPLVPLFVPVDKELSPSDVAEWVNPDCISLRDGLKTILPQGVLCESL